MIVRCWSVPVVEYRSRFLSLAKHHDELQSQAGYDVQGLYGVCWYQLLEYGEREGTIICRLLIIWFLLWQFKHDQPLSLIISIIEHSRSHFVEVVWGFLVYYTTLLFRTRHHLIKTNSTYSCHISYHHLNWEERCIWHIKRMSRCFVLLYTYRARFLDLQKHALFSTSPICSWTILHRIPVGPLRLRQQNNMSVLLNTCALAIFSPIAKLRFIALTPYKSIWKSIKNETLIVAFNPVSYVYVWELGVYLQIVDRNRLSM